MRERQLFSCFLLLLAFVSFQKLSYCDDQTVLYESFDEPFDGRLIVSKNGDYEAKDEKVAETYRQTTWKPKFDIEKEKQKAEDEAAGSADGLKSYQKFVFDLLYKVADLSFLSAYKAKITELIEKAEQHPNFTIGAVVYIVLVFFSLFDMLIFGGKKVPPEMESVEAVEKILKYNFRNKTLLKEALTHSSVIDSPCYERFEFLGDSATGLAISNYLYLTYPNLEPHELSLLRAANVSTEKLARVALNHGLYRFLRRNAGSLDEKVKEFSEAVSKEDDDSVVYGGLVKAPKVLADIVESVAGAVYIDVNFDLQRLWVIFRGLLEPVVTPDDLQRQPHPVSTLYKICQKNKKRINIRDWRDGNISVASVYIDDELWASALAENKDIARLIAAKKALLKLSEVLPVDGDSVEIGLKDAKMKLNEICVKKKWPKPIYSLEEDGCSVHGKMFVCSCRIKIPTEQYPLYMKGDEHSQKKKAESSSAYHMIRALRK